MGKDLYEAFREARAVYEKANEILGFSLSGLCFDGPEADLRLTINTQPALFVTSFACLKVLESRGVRPDVVAGHSVGEYAANAAAGSLTLEDGTALIRRRGELMQEAGVRHPGTMAAIIGLTPEKTEEACRAAANTGIVDVANFNSPGQIVISGETAAVEEAGRIAKEAGARKVIPLNVSGGFHSRLMLSTVDDLAKELASVPFRESKIPVAANISATYVRHPDEIRDALARQIAGSVQWEKSISMMIEDGVDTFIEVGPGKVLSGLIKRISGDVVVRNVGDVESLNAFPAS
jgi:[acyl-carrier-protein] S-malonyltransferase